jgi:hypothetical protein
MKVGVFTGSGVGFRDGWKRRMALFPRTLPPILCAGALLFSSCIDWKRAQDEFCKGNSTCFSSWVGIVDSGGGQAASPQWTLTSATAAFSPVVPDFQISPDASFTLANDFLENP